MSSPPVAIHTTPFVFKKSKDRVTHEFQYGDGSVPFTQVGTVLAMRITRTPEGAPEAFFRMLRVRTLTAADSSNTGTFTAVFTDMDDETLLEFANPTAVLKCYAALTSLTDPFCVRFQSLQASADQSAAGGSTSIDIALSDLWMDPSLSSKFSQSQLSSRDLLQYLHVFIVDDTILPSASLAKQLVEDQSVAKLRVRSPDLPSQPTSMLLLFSAKVTSSSGLLSSAFLDLYTDSDIRALKRSGTVYPLVDKLRAEIFSVYGVPAGMQASLTPAVDSYICQAAAARIGGMGAGDDLADYVPAPADATLTTSGGDSPALKLLATLKQTNWTMADELRRSSVDILQSFEKNDLRQRLDALINQNQKLDIALDSIRRSVRRTYLKYVAYNLSTLAAAVVSTVVCFVFGSGQSTRALTITLMMVFLVAFAILVVTGATSGA
ncbi:hypothetical protein HXX76_014152 [Chlamydomonas incerta]|uniref:Uncharacterized protein n=1 Tax=Chlamydomonas incerta TaxID=51695 RepID=A0A835VTJ3_CHLIN|nr:hypothetical protein HXX76_014152 [Chlamydomonas incerta]|eukprot:KAG2424994.1 hypothetical protein HXX76_014152 [Chlamydomonas incerta]